MADENLKIDLNRGVRMSKDPMSQLEVYMYLDTPGVYLDPLGHEVPEEIAARAGYDVEKFGKAQLKAQRMASFMETLDAELDTSTERTIICERDGYKLVEIGTLGHVLVVDDEDRPLVATPLPRELGEDLFNRMAPMKKKGVKSLAD